MKRIALSIIAVLMFWSGINAQNKITIEKYGVGPFTLATLLKNAPAAVPGLYNKMKVVDLGQIEDLDDHMRYVKDYDCYLNGVRILSVGTEEVYEGEEIRYVTVYGKNLKMDGKIYVGMPLAELRKIEGVRMADDDCHFPKYAYKDYMAEIRVGKGQNGQYYVTSISFRFKPKYIIE
ncbi:MAG: hypothetical protein IKS82_01830 [Bacteroidales bacterium]|nr:hypothetical protein [Bacteroidales bacterium]